MKRKLLVLNLVLLLVVGLMVACGPAPTVTVTAPAGPAPTVTVTAPGGAAATVTVTAPAASPAPTPTSTGVYNLTFAWSHETPDVTAIEIFRPGGEFQRMLYERSNGRIRVKVVEKMFPTRDNIAAVIQGRADMADTSMPYHTGDYPFWAWTETPGLIDPDPAVAPGEEMAVYNDPRARELFRREYRKLGLEHLFFGQSGAGNILSTKKPIATLADMKGLKIRASGLYVSMGLKALGGATVTMSVTEVETSMMTGVIDAYVVGPLSVNRLGLPKLAPYITYLPLSPVYTWTAFMNAKSFDALPADLQQVVRDVTKIAEYRVSSADMAEMRMALQGITLQGGKLAKLPANELASALQILAPVRAEWLKQAGPLGTELLSIAEEVITKYREFKPF
ncbi:MAG: TRAP transporter substrate-binding protein DctP [Chloroflexi bacterium]|nr:TRAP transporter substrate-binding protein DctP [Chloroflexota bacterium]